MTCFVELEASIICICCKPSTDNWNTIHNCASVGSNAVREFPDVMHTWYLRETQMPIIYVTVDSDIVCLRIHCLALSSFHHSQYT